jgi:hypothetical protein
VVSTPPTLAEVAGRNAKQIRGKATLEQMAKAARHYGLPWTIGRVGSFESGQVSPRLDTLIAVCAALHAVTGRPEGVALTDLFEGAGQVAVSDQLTMNRTKLCKVLSGEPVKIAAAKRERERMENIGAAAEADYRSWQPVLRKKDDLRLRLRVLADFADSDRALARSLKITEGHAAAAMAYCWGRTFVAERNRRAGADANAQRRGHVSRELKAELKEVLDGD